MRLHSQKLFKYYEGKTRRFIIQFIIIIILLNNYFIYVFFYFFLLEIDHHGCPFVVFN